MSAYYLLLKQNPDNNTNSNEKQNMNNLLLLPFTNFNYITFVRGIKTFLGMGSPLERAYSWAAKSFASVKRVPSTYRASQNGMGKSTSLLKPDCRARHWDYMKQAKRNSQNASVLKCIELYLQSLFILIPPSFQKDILRKPHGPSYELHRFNWENKSQKNFSNVFDVLLLGLFPSSLASQWTINFNDLHNMVLSFT